jgi:hypothetical protein
METNKEWSERVAVLAADTLIDRSLIRKEDFGRTI